MKKVIKYKSSFSEQIITLTVDEELNKLKGKVFAPKKLEEANKMLRENEKAITALMNSYKKQ